MISRGSARSGLIFYLVICWKRCGKPVVIPSDSELNPDLSVFWMNMTSDSVPNHLISADVEEFPASCREFAETLRGRSMLVRKAEPFPVECIARGYLIGSGWKDYQATGALCGLALPPGLQQADQLPEVLFTAALAPLFLFPGPYTVAAPVVLALLWLLRRRVRGRFLPPLPAINVAALVLLLKFHTLLPYTLLNKP